MHNGVRKAKVRLELNPVGDMKGNRKSFYRHISRGETWSNRDLLSVGENQAREYLN